MEKKAPQLHLIRPHLWPADVSFDREALLIGVIQSLVDFLLRMLGMHSLSKVDLVFPLVNGPAKQLGIVDPEAPPRAAYASRARTCPSMTCCSNMTVSSSRSTPSVRA